MAEEGSVAGSVSGRLSPKRGREGVSGEGFSQMVAVEIEGVQVGGVCVQDIRSPLNRCLARRYGGRQERLDRLGEKGWYMYCIEGR